MSLRIFETKDAKYWLGLGNHLESSCSIFKDVELSNLDMFVFEGDGTSGILPYLGEHQYCELYGQLQKEKPGISVYDVEVVPSKAQIKYSEYADGTLGILGVGLIVKAVLGIELKKYEKKAITRRDFLKSSAYISGGIALNSNALQLLSAFSDEKNYPLLDSVSGIRASAFPTPLTGFRDTVVAKKISEYLVPKHKKEHRKVNVGLIYGAGHSGIETKLLHPWLNSATLFVYDNLMHCATKERLNEIRQIVSSKNRTSITYEDCALF